MSSAFSFLFISDWLTWFFKVCEIEVTFLTGNTEGVVPNELNQTASNPDSTIDLLFTYTLLRCTFCQIMKLGKSLFCHILVVFPECFWIRLGVIFIPPQYFYFWACFSLPRLQTTWKMNFSHPLSNRHLFTPVFNQKIKFFLPIVFWFIFFKNSRNPLQSISGNLGQYIDLSLPSEEVRDQSFG